MSQSKRMILNKDARLLLSRTPDGSQKAEWIITGLTGNSPDSQGGSSICYDAKQGTKRGRLKEFYPGDVSINGRDWMYHFERTRDNQLRPIGPAMSRRFEAMCAEFAGAYYMLEQAKADDPRKQVLNNYMPAYEILYGFCEDGTRGTIYIWTPDDRQGETFEQYLSEVRANPGKLPEHKLYNILTTLITLTGCVRILHEADLLHLDIKPSNFLVLYDGSYNINPHGISIFDVNTLHSIYSSYPKIAGTPGYRAPEVEEGDACLASDLYSIGAMLYHAIIVSEDYPGLYEPGLYGDLDKIVADSKLIQASESNSNVYLRDRLATILKKTLAPRPDDRYECCEELIEDLQIAESFLKKQTVLDSQIQEDINPTAVIQELLFRHPLYRTVAGDDANINVLVLGTGTYGQQFLDYCLQAGQMINHRLRISAYSADPELDRRVYLDARPALSKFVNVNGSMKGKDAVSYGDLTFRSIPESGAFPRKRPQQLRSVLARVLSEAPDAEPYNYVFVSLGDDDLNREVACALREICPGSACDIHYVLQRREETEDCGANPVFINRSITTRAIDPDLDRMGFNTHLSWKSSLNVDVRKQREKYRNKYNQASSLAYALSIPSKLASVGIYDTDPVIAAREFQKKIVDHRRGEAKELFYRLVALEHRRWVLEKVTNGWRGLETAAGKPDYAALARRGLTKDNAARRHPCLVFSTEKTPLSNFTPAQWDRPGPHDHLLDELDRMSVELHRSFLTLAQSFLRSQPMKKLDLDAIRGKLTGAPEQVIEEFERYQLCIKNVLEGNRNYTDQFQTYCDHFEQSLQALDPGLKKEITSRIALISKSLKPVIESNLRKDYKLLDEILVMKIPFILTYQVQPYMAMAFEDGRLENGKNSVVFANVASATVINPQKITYLYHYDRNSSLPLLARKVSSVLNYFSRRNMRCQVAFQIAFAPEILPSQQEAVRKAFTGMVERKLIDSAKFHACQDADQAVEALMNELSGKRIDLFDCSVPLFSSPRDNLLLLEYVTRKYPNFEFDWKRKQFLGTVDCSYLRYIDDKSFVRIDEMFALMNAQDRKHYFPEFAEVYQNLWNVYTGKAYLTGPYAFTNGVNNWNRLCNQLEDITRANDQVFRLTYPVDEHLPVRTWEMYLPDYMYRTLEGIVARFREIGLILEQSRLTSRGSDTCHLYIQSDHNITDLLHAVISALYDHADLSELIVDSYPYREKDRTMVQAVNIRCDRLTVNRLTLDSAFTHKLLCALSDLHLINQFVTLDSSDEKHPVVSFRFTSPRMKKLLTTAGEILEVYTYYDIKRQGYFDDIATSFEFRWESGDITNELDCVLIKGFRSIIIECKSKRELDQDYYYKLWSIAEQFGLGTIKVLIANTYDTSATTVAENSLNRTRGRQLGIITISDPKEIQNIGATLRSIMEGTYPGVK